SIEFTHPSGFAAGLHPTPRARMESFADALRKADITVMIRNSSGEDIEAACGQLAVQEESRKRKQILSVHEGHEVKGIKKMVTTDVHG
ncbi:MAG: hypothetical protein HY276_04350, partial [Ignavibacteriales bacterium]|nr:hypothetical protein [Ignavibacteriales bacterium]